MCNKEIYLTYSFLFFHEKAKSPKDIENFINNYDAKKLIQGLVGLINLDHKHLNEIKNDFFSFLNREYTLSKLNCSFLYDENIVPFTHQTLLATMKWVILFGNFSSKNINNKFINNDEYINICILLCLMVADTFNKNKFSNNTTEVSHDEILFVEFNKNLYINNLNKTTNVPFFLRASYFFTDLTYNDELKKEADYLDYPTIFKNYYGYSIDEYLGTIFMLYASFSKNFQYLSNVKNDLINRLPKNDSKIEIVQKILNHHTITLNDAKSLLKKDYNKEWNNDFFFKYTFLELPNNECLFLYSPILYYNIFLSLKIEIQKAYKNIYTDTKKDPFLSFCGKLQEKYIFNLANKTLSNLDYIKIIPEFEYKPHNKSSKYKTHNKSSDLMISIGKNTLLIFESKFQSLRKASLFTDDYDTFLKDEERLFVKPLKQIIKSAKEVMDKGDITTNLSDNTTINFNLNGYSNIYIFSLLTESTFINPYKVKKLQNVIDNTLQQEPTLRNKIKGYYSIDLNDFEMLLSLLFLSKKKTNIKSILKEIFNKKYTIFCYLYKTKKYAPLLPFFKEKQYLFDKSISSIFPKWNENMQKL